MNEVELEFENDNKMQPHSKLKRQRIKWVPSFFGLDVMEINPGGPLE